MYMLTEFGHIMERRFNISENMSRVEHILKNKTKVVYLFSVHTEELKELLVKIG